MSLVSIELRVAKTENTFSKPITLDFPLGVHIRRDGTAENISQSWIELYGHKDAVESAFRLLMTFLGQHGGYDSQNVTWPKKAHSESMTWFASLIPKIPVEITSPISLKHS
ncbi:MAG: hypothetical protein ABI758_00740 [Candidatus Woesebacteria bacterium]